MIWFLLIFVVGGIAALVYRSEYKDYKVELAAHEKKYANGRDAWGEEYNRPMKPEHIGYIIVAVFISGFLMFVANAICYVNVGEWKHDTVYLEALQDNVGYQGRSSFLGSGQSQDVPVYYYYGDYADGVRLSRVTTRNTTIQFDQVPPQLWRFYRDRGSHFWCVFQKTSFDRFEFHVPRGTITNDYRLDAQ